MSGKMTKAQRPNILNTPKYQAIKYSRAATPSALVSSPAAISKTVPAPATPNTSLPPELRKNVLEVQCNGCTFYQYHYRHGWIRAPLETAVASPPLLNAIPPPAPPMVPPPVVYNTGGYRMKRTPPKRTTPNRKTSKPRPHPMAPGDRHLPFCIRNYDKIIAQKCSKRPVVKHSFSRLSAARRYFTTLQQASRRFQQRRPNNLGRSWNSAPSRRITGNRNSARVFQTPQNPRQTSTSFAKSELTTPCRCAEIDVIKTLVTKQVSPVVAEVVQDLARKFGELWEDNNKKANDVANENENQQGEVGNAANTDLEQITKAAALDNVEEEPTEDVVEQLLRFSPDISEECFSPLPQNVSSPKEQRKCFIRASSQEDETPLERVEEVPVIKTLVQEEISENHVTETDNALTAVRKDDTKEGDQENWCNFDNFAKKIENPPNSLETAVSNTTSLVDDRKENSLPEPLIQVSAENTENTMPLPQTEKTKKLVTFENSLKEINIFPEEERTGKSTTGTMFPPDLKAFGDALISAPSTLVNKIKMQNANKEGLQSPLQHRAFSFLSTESAEQGRSDQKLTSRLAKLKGVFRKK